MSAQGPESRDRAAQGNGSHLSVLLEGRKNLNNHASSGVLLENPG
jgi:hypothetical protein